MTDSLVFNVPVEVRLKFVPPIGPNHVDAKWELPDRVIDEINGVLLCVPLVDLVRPDSCGIVDCRLLKTADLVPVGGLESQEFHVHLDVMARDLFRVPTRVNRPATHFSRQAPQAMSDERPINTRARGFNPLVAFEIPGDPLRAEVIDASEVKDLLDNLWGELIWVALHNGFFRISPSMPSFSKALFHR